MTTHVEVKQIWPPMRTPRSILRGTNTVPLIQLAGCTVQSHQQVSLKATDSVVGHQSISSFSSTERIWGSWEKLCLKWYLCVPAFFTVLSWLGLHNKKKQQEHGHESSGTTLITSLIYVNYHFFLCLFSQHTILWLFIATVAAPHKTTLCNHVLLGFKIKQKTESYLLNLLRSCFHYSAPSWWSSEKDKEWRNKVIQREVHI